MIKFMSTISAALLLGGTCSAAETVYSEDFSNPAKLGNTGATAELGNSGSYVLGTWVYSTGNGGVNDPEEGDGSGADANNEISTLGHARPQAGRGNNARAVGVIWDNALFENGVEYTVSFDFIGDEAGNNAGRYWLALVSGYGPDDSILIDGTQDGWGSAKPFNATGTGGNAAVNYVVDSASNGVLLEGENSAGTNQVSFTFTHDGFSDVAFAVGTYNNIFAIDNIEITRQTGGGGGPPATGLYEEDFDDPTPGVVVNFQFQLGGTTTPANTSFIDPGEWGHFSLGGITNIGGAFNNAIRPHKTPGGTNSRGAGTFIDPALFSGVAGGTPVTVTFDVINDGQTSDGRAYVWLCSGYDTNGAGNANCYMDISGNNFNSDQFFVEGREGAFVELAAEYVFDAKTSGTRSFQFTYDGSSTVALVFGSYANDYLIDNIVMTAEAKPPSLRISIIKTAAP